MVDLPDVELLVAPFDGGTSNWGLPAEDCIPVFSADRDVSKKGVFMPPRGLSMTWQPSWFMLETHQFYAPVSRGPLHILRSARAGKRLRDMIPKAAFRGWSVYRGRQ